jgi:hypothetical protein
MAETSMLSEKDGRGGVTLTLNRPLEAGVELVMVAPPLTERASSPLRSPLRCAGRSP